MVLLFVLSVIMLFATILFYPKSDEKQDLFAQATIALLTVMEAHTLWGYITLELLEIGFELEYYARYNFCFALIILLYWIIVKGRRVQKFCAKPHMWITAGLLFIVTAFIGIWRYGPKLNLFAYCSADSANHLSKVLNIFKYADLGIPKETRYFLHLNEALLFKCVARWVQPMSYYRVFLLCELVFFYLSGAMFYTLIQKYIDARKKSIVGIIFVFLYVLGYPFNNLLYGYEYLGASVTIAGHIVYLLERFVEKKRIQWDIFSVLVIACFAMYHCYSLLCIGIFAGLGVVFLMHMMHKPTIIKFFLLFMSFIVILYRWNIFLNYAEKMVGKLQNDASMYRNLWGNFLWFLPFVIVGIYICFKMRKKDIVVGMALGNMVSMIVFFLLLEKGHVSSYYYYKLYYLMWLFVLYVATIGAVSISKKGGKVIVLYLVVLVGLSRVETIKMIQNGQEEYFGIYGKNRDVFIGNICNMDNLRQELFYVAASKVAETSGVVPYIGEWEKHWAEYYYALTNQSISKVGQAQILYIYDRYKPAEEQIGETLQRWIYEKYDDVPYIMVERNSEAYWYGIGYYSTLEVVYENKYGFLYKR